MASRLLTAGLKSSLCEYDIRGRVRAFTGKVAGLTSPGQLANLFSTIACWRNCPDVHSSGRKTGYATPGSEDLRDVCCEGAFGPDLIDRTTRLISETIRELYI